MRRTGETWLRMFVLLGTLAGLTWIAVFGGVVPRAEAVADDVHAAEEARRAIAPAAPPASSPFSSTVRRSTIPEPQARPVVDASAPRADRPAVAASWNGDPSRAAAATSAAGRPEPYWPSEAPSGGGPSTQPVSNPARPGENAALGAAAQPMSVAQPVNIAQPAAPAGLDPRGGGAYPSAPGGYPSSAAAVPAGASWDAGSFPGAANRGATPSSGAYPGGGYPSGPAASGAGPNTAYPAAFPPAADARGYGAPPAAVPSTSAPPTSLPPAGVPAATEGRPAAPMRPSRSRYPTSVESRADLVPTETGGAFAATEPADVASPYAAAVREAAGAAVDPAVEPAGWRTEPTPQTSAYEAAPAAVDDRDAGLAQPRRSTPAPEAGAAPSASTSAPESADWRRSPELPRLEARLRAAGAVFYRLDRLPEGDGYRFVCQAGGDGGASPREFAATAREPLGAIRQVLADVLADLDEPARPAGAAPDLARP